MSVARITLSVAKVSHITTAPRAQAPAQQVAVTQAVAQAVINVPTTPAAVTFTPAAQSSSQGNSGSEGINYSFHGFFSAAGAGCIASSSAVAMAGLIATGVTFGAAAGPSAEAVVDACGNGALGGAVTYMLAGGNDVNDSSGAEDMREYFQDNLRF